MSKKARKVYEAGPPLSLDEAKRLGQGKVVFARFASNADGSPQRWRVTSVNTWKRSPERVEVRLKRGQYQYARLSECNLSEVSATFTESVIA